MAFGLTAFTIDVNSRLDWVLFRRKSLFVVASDIGMSPSLATRWPRRQDASWCLPLFRGILAPSQKHRDLKQIRVTLGFCVSSS